MLLMSRYEVQVLDSWNNKTYADGQAGAIYGWWPPLAGKCSPESAVWQTYDIMFEAPKFDGSTLTKPAFVTVILNNVLVQNHQEIGGPIRRIVRSGRTRLTEMSL